VDGGGWLTVDGEAVDWIYRDLDRVERCWRDAEQGRYAFHAQVGHHWRAGLRVPGEVAPRGDPGRSDRPVASVRRRTTVFPPALADALIAGLWEADFLLGVARKAVTRRDVGYVSGACSGCSGCVRTRCTARRPLAGQRKGAIAAAAALPGAPARSPNGSTRCSRAGRGSAAADRCAGRRADLVLTRRTRAR